MSSTWFGLDLGGTKCLGVAVRNDEIVEEFRAETDAAGPAEVIDLLRRVYLQLEKSTGEPTAVGVGLPGLVTRSGVLAYAPNLPGVEAVQIRRELEAGIGVPVVVDNDAAAAAWGEFRVGAGREADSMLAITLGTGVGGGIVLGGQLLRGANGFAAEVGHIPFAEDGKPCACGKRGCWEAYASGTALGALAAESLGPETTGEDVTENARRGDPEALAVMKIFAERVARGLGGLIEVLDPELVVIGGGLVEAGDVLLEPVVEALPRFVYSWPHRPPTPVEPALLGERAGAMGAALLAADRP